MDVPRRTDIPTAGDPPPPQTIWRRASSAPLREHACNVELGRAALAARPFVATFAPTARPLGARLPATFVLIPPGCTSESNSDRDVLST